MLSRSNIIGLLLLLGAAFALRIPSFWAEYVSTDESIYLIGGERIAAGGCQYVDTWDNKPPVLQWFYAGFSWLFGSGALLAVRVFTCLYLFFAALVFNQMLAMFRFTREASLVPAFLFLLSFSVPWYTQEMNAEHLMSLPMLASFLLVLRHSTDENPRQMNLFWAGLLCALCVGIKYQGVFHFAALFVGAVMVGRFGLQQAVTFGGAMVLGLLSFLLIFYFNGSLPAFYDVSFLYSFDYVLVGDNPGEANPRLANLFEYAKVWGGLALVALAGFVALRARASQAAIRQRKFETLMLLWLIFNFLGVAIGGRFYLHYMLLPMPAILFYAYWFHHHLVSARLRWLPWLLWLAFPLFSYSAFFAVSSNGTFAAVKGLFPSIRDDGWLQGLYNQVHLTPAEEALRVHLQSVPPDIPVWVSGFRPELYIRLNRACALKYTNFSIAYYKMLWLPHNIRLRGRLVSKEESLADVYRTLQASPPRVVLDLDGTFAQIKYHLPVLLADYEASTVGAVEVFAPTANPSR